MRIGSWTIPLPSLPTIEKDAAKVEKALPAPVRAVAKQAVDSFDQTVQSLAKNQAITGNGDQVFDGDLVGAGGHTYASSTPLTSVPAMLPKDGVTNSEILIEVNGVGQNVAGQKYDMGQLANASGSRVIGLHNATDGWAVDAAQEMGDELHIGPDEAAASLTHLVEQQLAAGQPVHLVAHSQGAAITARALTQVRADLIQKLGSASAADQELHNVKVETFAGAAWNYPDGPQYRHYVNTDDVVPQVFGQGIAHDLGLSHPGAAAQLYTFSQTQNFHSFETYLPHRLPW